METIQMNIIQNEAQCRKCGDIIWSGNRHDFKSCKCGAISVDGGMEYIRRVGDPADIIERSLHMKLGHLKNVVEQVGEMRESGRNSIGIALGVIRSLRDDNLLDIDKFTNKMDK